MTDIITSDLTTKVVGGTGVFDELMVATLAHLDTQYLSNRLKGVDYANVYLGSIQAVLQQSSAFLLAKDTAAAQVDLLRAQIISQGVQDTLGLAQVALAEKELELKATQLDISLAELEIKQAELVNLPKQGVLLDAQAIKINSEISLLKQKKLTEEAQIKDTVAGVAVVGVIGKQKALYAQQTLGFLRDAEQKAAKIMADAFNIEKTVAADPSKVPSVLYGLDGPSVKSVIDILKTGVEL